jgi:hypothetical protein
MKSWGAVGAQRMSENKQTQKVLGSYPGRCYLNASLNYAKQICLYVISTNGIYVPKYVQKTFVDYRTCLGH